jgi:large-conductance mechanosensitive channel
MLKDFREFILLTFVIVAAVIFFFVVKPVNALMARMKTAEVQPAL